LPALQATYNHGLLQKEEIRNKTTEAVASAIDQGQLKLRSLSEELFRGICLYLPKDHDVTARPVTFFTASQAEAEEYAKFDPKKAGLCAPM